MMDFIERTGRLPKLKSWSRK